MSFNKVKKLWLVSCLFTLCFCFINTTYADALETKLSRDRVSLGETVTITFNLNNVTTKASPDFSPLEKDFRIIDTRYGRTINVLNGNMQTQTFWQVTLEPKGAGEILIPEINFGQLKSPARKLLVEEAATVVADEQQNAAVFVQANLNTTQPYVQSQVLYTFKLFYRTQLENPNMEIPQIKNSTLAPVGADKSYQTTIKGEDFFVLEKNFAIFPQKDGKLFIPPMHFRASQYDIHENFMSDPFSIASNKLVTLATKSFTLDVKKIPDNFHDKVWLPAQNISLTEKWSADPNQWELGNPITRTITIEAQGLRADQIPDLPVYNISGVNIYADPPHRKNSLQGNSLLGTWQQKITYIPNSITSFTIPALQLNWWNTQTDRNAIAQIRAITVQVQRKMNAQTISSAPSLPTTIEKTKKSDLAPKNSVPSGVQKLIKNEDSLFYLSIWFWIAIASLIIWLITFLWIFKNKAPTKTANLNPFATTPAITPMELNSKTFRQACEQGDPILAQNFLLWWAKTEWPEDPPRNLTKLREKTHDESFKKALENLEQSLYRNKELPWNGQTLLAAYEQEKKQKAHGNSYFSKARVSKHRKDPLPPLNP